MMLLSSDDDLAQRRDVADGPLAALAASLAADLDPLRSRELYFPTQKALLSREGGRCARDGTLLEFDPFSPGEHRCPTCGEMYQGELHDRFWIYWYQLWLAERAVHAALLSRLGRRELAPLAVSILEGYTARYETYPNVDNVLGPTRLFFSTYLESIWLLQICVATDLLDATEPALTARVRDRVIAPSRSIIAVYDEGASNRQVWNNAALLASARLLGDDHAVERAVFGPSGIATLVSQGLLLDGTWYEGENYHLFAHRGLWYGVTMAERAGLPLPDALTQRFQLAFAAPFFTALPDFTLPSRRDSQYAISLRQWRIAEHCELGLARGEDPVLVGALERMYCDDVPRRATGRSTSAADVERNVAPSALSRSDLSWRALLCARPTLPTLESSAPRSALLEGQGITVFRRDAGRAYIALDYGHSGGGHGHPDRLNLLLCHGDTRWLDDFGTGSYVDPTLHWYRSTLAHNAPLFDGTSQRSVHGTLVAFDERGAAGWVVAAADGVGPGISAERAIVVMPSYSIDLVSWRGDREATVDLPLHADLSIIAGATSATANRLQGGTGLEDGFEFTHDTTVQLVENGATIRAQATGSEGQLDVWAISNGDCEWWRAVAPGPPGRGEHAFRVLRTRGVSGTHRLLWSWSGEVSSVEFAETIRVTLVDGTVHDHRQHAGGWHVDLIAGGARSSIDLAGFVEPVDDRVAPESSGSQGIMLPGVNRTVAVELTEDHYRRSEQSWSEADRPAATVTLTWTGDSLLIDVAVPRSDLNFVPATVTNRYDNEHPDVNGDGVQLYVRTALGIGAWMLVPDSLSDGVRTRTIDASGIEQLPVARWERSGSGYRMTIEMATSAPPLGIDVIVNEMPRGRERRRGQLVMSGARGEFVYLRGDRHEPERLLPLRFADE